MKPGTKPKPTSLKLLEGNKHKDRINENEPQPSNPLLKSPVWLIDDAKKIWDKYSLVLKNLKIFKQTDEIAFACLCQEAGRYIELQKIIIKKGYTTSNIRNGDKSIPEMAMARECLKQAKSLMAEFGLTPSSRSRISIPTDGDENDPLEKMLSSMEKKHKIQ